MAMLSAWKFTTLPGADAALEKLNRDFLIKLHDEAVVSREVGRMKPNTVMLPVRQFGEGACEHELRP